MRPINFSSPLFLINVISVILPKLILSDEALEGMRVPSLTRLVTYDKLSLDKVVDLVRVGGAVSVAGYGIVVVNVSFCNLEDICNSWYQPQVDPAQVLHQLSAINQAVRMSNPNVVLCFSGVIPPCQYYVNWRETLIGYMGLLQTYAASSYDCCFFVDILKHVASDYMCHFNLFDSKLKLNRKGMTLIENAFRQAFSYEFLLEQAYSRKNRDACIKLPHGVV